MYTRNSSVQLNFFNRDNCSSSSLAEDEEIEQRIDAKNLLSSTEEQRTDLKVHIIIHREINLQTI
jgi:hypothetical protein